ncbi:MAG: hypothetical protein AAF191_19260 [Verrucomicrobiota bacterium]
MSAEVYELVVSLMGSALAGLLLFGIGLLVGFLIWGGDRKKATKAEEKTSGVGGQSGPR